MIGLVVAGLASGVGKTTLTLGLIGALKRRGLAVQPFKVGPDYIDPSQHAQVAGRPSRNIDSWQVPEAGLRELFWRATATADAAIVEGVMGLFDGRTGAGEVGSTAQVAKLLDLPVLLVVDAAKAGRSVAAAVVGARAIDPGVRIVGVVLNNVAGERHAAIGREAIESLAKLPVLGWLPRDAELRQEERYLGLVPGAERRVSETLVGRAVDRVESQIDLSRLVQVATVPRNEPESSGLFPAESAPTCARIAVAQDAAFSFYYQDSLDLLSAWGAELVPFSPLRDERLPDGIGGVYLGGGFPELFAIDLAVNAPMLEAVRAAARRGLPIYAECGGLMYLQDALIDADGRRHRMAGLVPGVSTLASKRLTLGYREARARQDNPIARAGQTIRGHEFHWSVCESPPDKLAAWEILDGTGRVEGYASGTVLASYVHVHFASDPGLAPRFVAACIDARPRDDDRTTDRRQCVVLGVGCTSDASPDELASLACAALSDAGLSLQHVSLIATVASRLDHPAVVGLAARAGADRRGYTTEELGTITDVPTPSSAVQRQVGTASVSEAAALLASSGGSLVMPKRKSARATVAVAMMSAKG
jgi:cobyrinic acid a,c-diamide synthase